MLIAVVASAVVVGLVVGLMARGSNFDGIGSDAWKHVDAAAQFEAWGGWPSGMHRFAGNKAWMKDVGVLLLVPMQRILSDAKGFYPVVMVSNATHVGSAILTYLVAEGYWGTEAGVAVFVLYLSCLWPYKVVLHGAYQVVAQMFLLLAIYLLQQAQADTWAGDGIWYCASGAAFGLMNYSSASARKLIPLYFAALFYHAAGSQALPWWLTGRGAVVPAAVGYAVYSISAAFIIGWAVISLSYKKVIRYIYDGRLAKYYSFRAKDGVELDEYLAKGQVLVSEFRFYGSAVVCFLWSAYAYLSSPHQYLLVAACFSGVLSIVVLLTSPNTLQNILGYRKYWNATYWASHDHIYADYFSKKYGKAFKNTDLNLIWYPRFFMRMLPFHTLAVVLSAVVVLSAGPLGPAVVLLIVAPLPFLWSIVTMGPKASLPFYPTFITFLIPVGFAFGSMDLLAANIAEYASLALWACIVVGAIWNCYIFVDDIWPSRMAVKRIMGLLRRLGAKEIFTYECMHNDPFAKLIEAIYPSELKVRRIDRLLDVKEGYVFVPPTSSKGAYYQSAEIGPEGELSGDETLNQLIESGEIEDLAVGRFKTLASSKYWQQIGDVVSLRDLVLGEVKSADRFRGLVWVLDAAKVQQWAAARS